MLRLVWRVLCGDSCVRTIRVYVFHGVIWVAVGDPQTRNPKPEVRARSLAARRRPISVCVWPIHVIGAGRTYGAGACGPAHQPQPPGRCHHPRRRPRRRHRAHLHPPQRTRPSPVPTCTSATTQSIRTKSPRIGARSSTAGQSTPSRTTATTTTPRGLPMQTPTQARSVCVGLMLMVTANARTCQRTTARPPRRRRHRPLHRRLRPRRRPRRRRPPPLRRHHRRRRRRPRLRWTATTPA